MRKSKILLSIITVFLLILLPSCESPLDYRIGEEGIAVYYHEDPYMEIYLADYYNTKQAKLEYEGEIRNVNFFYRGDFEIQLGDRSDDYNVDNTIMCGTYDVDFNNGILYLYPFTDNYPEWESVYALKKGVVK